MHLDLSLGFDSEQTVNQSLGQLKFMATSKHMLGRGTAEGLKD